MNAWLTPAVAIAVITGLFTYLGTKRTSKAQLETIYSESIQKLIEEYQRSQAELKSEVSDLKKQMIKLKADLDVKDQLIAELRKDIHRLEMEKADLKRLLKKGGE